MKSYFIYLAIGLTLFLCGAMERTLFANASYDEARYKAIIDRKPFGSEVPPAGMTSGQPGTPGGIEPYIKFIKISAFVRDDVSPIIRVGLVETKSNQSYLLAVGEESEGLRLVKADFENEKVLLCKDKQYYWLGMDGAFTSGSDDNTPAVLPEPVPSPPSAESSEPAPRRMTTRVVPPKFTQPAGDTASISRPTKRLSLRERRRLYEEEMQKKAMAQAGVASSEGSGAEQSPDSTPEPLPATSERVSPDLVTGGTEIDAQLREYQMQAIREGREPLPIPLTPDMDEQLVNEGVLPPVQ